MTGPPAGGDSERLRHDAATSPWFDVIRWYAHVGRRFNVAELTAYVELTEPSPPAEHWEHLIKAAALRGLIERVGQADDGTDLWRGVA